MSFGLATSESIVAKASINVDKTAAASGTLLEQFSNEAEAFVNMYTRFDWTGNSAKLFANASAAIQEAVSNLAGSQLMIFDTTGFLTDEIQNNLNFLNFKTFKILDLINDDPSRKFVIDGSTGAK